MLQTCFITLKRYRTGVFHKKFRNVDKPDFNSEFRGIISDSNFHLHESGNASSLISIGNNPDNFNNIQNNRQNATPIIIMLLVKRMISNKEKEELKTLRKIRAYSILAKGEMVEKK